MPGILQRRPGVTLTSAQLGSAASPGAADTQHTVTLAECATTHALAGITDAGGVRNL